MYSLPRSLPGAKWLQGGSSVASRNQEPEEEEETGPKRIKKLFSFYYADLVQVTSGQLKQL